MSDTQEKYIQYINEVWIERQSRNSAYSLRAFARDLDVSPTTLSLILSKKRPLTLERAIEWVRKLSLNKEQSENFLEAVRVDSQERINPHYKKSIALEEKIKYTEIDLDQFAIISDWYYLAILNLTEVKNFKNDVLWIADQLDISEKQCEEAIDRLIRLKLLENQNGKLMRTSNSITTPTNIPSSAVKNYHHQNIMRALESLEKDAVTERDITSIIMPIDKTKLAEAKKMISNFRRELSLFLKAKEGDQVYSLNIQLFPQNEGEKEA